MKIFFRQMIPDQMYSFDQTFTSQELELPEDTCHCLSPLSVHAECQRVDDQLLATFQVNGRYRLICCRCLEPLEIEKTDAFDLTFDIDSAIEYVDCDDDLRQELILASTVKPLCDEHCRGLCLRCGVNLNKEKCQCHGGD